MELSLIVWRPKMGRRKRKQRKKMHAKKKMRKTWWSLIACNTDYSIINSRAYGIDVLISYHSLFLSVK